MYKGFYQVTLEKFPKGTYFKAGDKSGTMDSFIEIVKVKEVTSMLGKVPVDKILDYEVDPESKIEIIRPDGTWAEIKLPPTRIGYAIKDALAKVENGPVKFGDEGDEDPKPGLSILFNESISKKVYGQASVLSDIDAVAIARLLPDVKGTKTCTGYQSNDKKPMPDIELQLKETEVVIYHRRKGGEVAKKVFPPNKRCPTYTFQRKGENTSDSSKPTRDIEAWLRTQAK